MDEPSRIESQLKKKDPPFLGSRIEKLIADLLSKEDIEAAKLEELTQQIIEIISDDEADDQLVANLIQQFTELQNVLAGIDFNNFVKKNFDVAEEGTNIQSAGWQLRSQKFAPGANPETGEEYTLPEGFTSHAQISCVEGWRIGWNISGETVFFDFGSTKGPDKDGIYSNCTLMSKSGQASNIFCINFAKSDGTYHRIEFNPDELAIKVYDGGFGQSYLVNTIDLRTLQPYDDTEIRASISYVNEVLNSAVLRVNSNNVVNNPNIKFEPKYTLPGYPENQRVYVSVGSEHSGGGFDTPIYPEIETTANNITLFLDTSKASIYIQKDLDDGSGWEVRKLDLWDIATPIPSS